jgi:Mrp family chromosome partitioning ATPase
MKLTFALTATDSSQTVTNMHWAVTRSVNSLFTGRTDELNQIENAIRRSLADTNVKLQKRYVITGMGGQGKSELCLNIANSMRQSYVYLLHSAFKIGRG